MKKFLACVCALMFAFSSSAFASTGYVSVVKKIKESKEYNESKELKEHKKHYFKRIKKRKIIIDYKYEIMDDGTAVVKSPSGEMLFKFKDKSIFDSSNKEVASYNDECFVYKETDLTMVMLNPNGEIFESHNVGNKSESFKSFKRGRIGEGSTTQLSAIYKKKHKICQFNKCIPKVIAVFISLMEDLNLVNTTGLGSIGF